LLISWETLSAVCGSRFGNSKVADDGEDVTIASVCPRGLRNCSVTVSPVSCQSKLPYALRCWPFYARVVCAVIAVAAFDVLGTRGLIAHPDTTTIPAAISASAPRRAR
jgi:hypothetical protein